MTSRFLRLLTVVALASLLPAACAPAGTIAPADARVASASAGVAPGAAVSPVPASAAPASAAPPAGVLAAAPRAVWPLTGLTAEDRAATRRRPLNVRLPNEPAARPQFGLSRADLVFELIVEGGVTRYAAVFQSREAEAVGPVRSYRWSDLHITQMLRGALVASGASREETDGVTRSIAAGNMFSVDEVRAGGTYYRVAFRAGPNNLFTSTGAARDAVERVGGGAPVDVPALAFLPSLDHLATAGGFIGSGQATKVTIPFENSPSTFTWDEGSKGYRRSQNGVPTVDPDGNVPILARNVIVMWTNIWNTSVVEDIYGSLGLDYRMTGGGAASVFRDGRRQDGTWKRDGALDMFTFFDQNGEAIALEPGQSWIHFVYPGWTVTSIP